VEKVWASRRVGQLLDEIQLHGRVQEVVDELIQLSKQYGIVTPYTSFLANENQDFAAHREIRSRTLSSLEKSAGTVTGPQAQMDAASRDMAKKMAAPLPISSGGFAMSLGSADQSAYENGATEELTTIRIVGNLTLYKKGDAWLTSETVELDPARDLKMFKVVQRYSDEYFALIRDNTPDENRVFAAQLPGEKLGIRLRGTAYLIE
jgi:Ca-activated chloride channel family protein